MRYGSLGGLFVGAWIGVLPLAAHADYLSNAQAALQKGDLKAAQLDLRNAVRADPQNGEAHYWLGKVSLELGDPVATEREAVAARDRGFDPHLAIPLLAQSLLSQGKFDALLESIKPAGKDSSLDSAIMVIRGYAQMGLKQPEEAQKSFLEAEQIAPNAVEPLLAESRLALSRGDLNAAQAKIDQALSLQPKSLEALLAKAEVLRLKGDAIGALSVLDELVAEQPATIQGRLERAGLEIAVNKMDAAKADIDAVLKATPGNVQATYLRAQMKAQSQDFKGANADLDLIAAFLPRIPRGYYLQALVKERIGQIEQAEDAAQRYLGRAPNDLAAYNVLARIQLTRHRPDQVIETLARVAESGKGDAETYDLLGRAYAATNQGPEAVKAFQKAETLAPTDIGLQTRLASVRMGLGQADAARGELEHTLELAPKLPSVAEALFFASLATGDLNKAADAIAKIRAAQGETPMVQNLEGLLKLAQLDVGGAREVFAAIGEKSPDFVPAQANLARTMAMQGQQADAEKLLAEILAKQPAAEPALSLLAATYAQSQRLPQALALLQRAHQAEPSNSRITVSLGDLYIRNGNPQKALELADTDKTGAGSEPLLGLRAAAQLAAGQKDKARETYSEVLKADPTQLGARRQLVSLLVAAGDVEQARNVVKAGMVA
ncbi:MAG: PEP-CTERM system TPR-repeat protein PrsT, partial [Acetobacteraceae bacterium]|nr:PEP-CTERM system TPR-repeat protein PrsT [Acetobacteraceae bacterium]